MKNLFIFIAFFISFNSYSQENIVLTGNKKEDAIAYFNRGLSKAKLQDYRGAIADFTKAIELKPDNAEAYYNRGNAKYELKDLNAACLDWNKSGELGYASAYDLIKQYCN